MCLRTNALILALVVSTHAYAADMGNRLTYLDEFCDPYGVGLNTPKLVTPQWVGEPGVEAVIVLAIDDMTDSARYEAFLRPILERLKQIDGRAPVSIMTKKVDPRDPQLAAWLAEGLSFEVHTVDHPCPCLQGGRLAAAKDTFDRCVDLMAGVPGNRPVAYRMPCCDSMNSVSPRFFTQVFNKTTPAGRYLTLDTSVFQLFTANDPALPRALVFDRDGRERFRKYVPIDRVMVNLVEDYPYPYVIGRLAWEFPCVMPSDWDAQHLNGKCSPATVRDFKAAIDAAVMKEGVFSLCFHPHGWIAAEQVVELIDYADRTYAGKIKFLTFGEVQRRLDTNLLGGHPLRTGQGSDNGVRIVDLDNDGTMDVVIGNPRARQTRLWNPKTGRWLTGDFPLEIVSAGPQGRSRDAGVRFGVLHQSGRASILVRNAQAAGVWHFDGRSWARDSRGLDGLDLDGPILSAAAGRDLGVRLRDLDGDGVCELVVGNPKQPAVFQWSAGRQRWLRLPFLLPDGTTIVDARGRDAGLRFVDVDEDGRADVLFSNADRYWLCLFTSIREGWSRNVLSGRRGDEKEIPPIVRADGTNNGAWFNYRHMWVQNEDTGKAQPDHVAGRYFTDLLAAEPEPPPRTPESSLRSFKLAGGFTIELVAAEPMVADPIDIAWGPDGKLWVVEMADYPMGLDNQGQIGGRVRFLEDTDGDGRYDKSTVFLEPVGFPTGVMPWRNGVLITAAPTVFYAEDTDGDGRADVRQTLFDGFHEGNQQHRVNHMRWGLDNWVYVANGDSDGQIRSLKTGTVVDISGRDLRFRPDQGLLDPQTGRSQFGRNRDDWGNWFGCNNNNPGWSYVLADHYIRRNPYVAAPRGRLDLTDYRDVYPAGRVMTHCFYDQPTPPEGHPGRWTSVASVMIYRDALFGPRFAGNLFVDDSVYNVVHRMILSHNGIRIRGRRPPDEDQSEFLATSDPWFRPTTIRTGPDGALWVADMYRYVIEHPQWIDDRLEKTLDLRRGHDRGRIWRIYPVDKRPRPIPRLDGLDTAGLVAALDSPNGPQRDLAHQMLLWRGDQAAVKPLEAMVKTNARAVARLHAMCVLDGLGALRPEIVLRGLADDHPGVRRHAVRLSESFVDKSPAVGDALVKLADDPDPFVQMQLAYSLGAWSSPRAGRALGQLAARHADDPYLMAAVLSSAVPHAGTMLAEVRAAGGRADLVKKLAKLQKDIEANPDVEAMVKTVERIAPQRLGEGVIARQTTARVQAALDKFAVVPGMAGDPVRGKKVFVDATCSTCHRLEDVGENIGPDIRTLVDRSPENLLVATIDPNRAVKERFVEYVAISADGLAYNGMLMDQSSTSVTLANTKGEKTTILNKDLEELAPTPQSFMPEGLEERLDVEQMADLMAFLGKAGQPRRRFPGNNPTTVLAAKDGSFELSAEKAEIYGAEITFDPGANGHLGSWQSAEAYVVWSLHLNRGQKFDVWLQAACSKAAAGNPFLVEVGAHSITGEVGATAGWDDYRWQKIGQLKLDTGSYRLGFRSDGPIQSPLINLRAIKLTRVGQRPWAAGGKEPGAVKPEADGSLRLAASAGRGVGPSIKHLPGPKAFGRFTAADHVEWLIAVTRPGYYEVWLEWSVDDASAGKPWDLRIGGSRLIGAVGRTGSSETYRRMMVGRIELKAGVERATFGPGGGFDGTLMNFREIRLVASPPGFTEPK